MAIPPGALAQAVAIAVAPMTAPPAGAIPGTAYAFGPDGTTFASPAVVTIAYDPALLPAGVAEADLELALLVGAAWTPVAGSAVDAAADAVSGTTSHFSSFALVPRAPRPPPAIARASAGAGGVAGDGDSPPLTALGRPSVSRDGRLVAFASSAANLVAADGNSVADVFVRDLVSEATVRVSVTSAGEEGRAPSRYPVISGDGRYVVFATQANLDPADTTSQVVWDLYRHDLSSSTTELVDVDAGGTIQSQAFAPAPAVSGDGRFVAWRDFATPRILVKDMLSGALDPVAVPVVPTPLGDVWDPLVSDDGQVVAFVSSHAHQAGQANVYPSVFALDRARGTVERIALGTTLDMIQPTIGMSASGDVIAYATRSPQLFPDDNATWDVYAHVRSAATNPWLVSVGAAGDASGGPAFFGSGAPFVSADGSTVAYQSSATNLVTGIAGAGDVPQVFVRATFGGRTYQLSACGGLAGNATSGDPALSGDGLVAVFWSAADNLLGSPGACSGDANGKVDVFAAR
ncbi:MAG TPA: hypothetical protein VLD85_05670 [Anaeromyxobacteraceae bacterium]|nr:hypothetical protein [Anaeromyxobacteraceae bacterium]